MTPLSSVLIVDDEPAVRDIMARWVTSLGLEPRTAANADEALATLRARHYDLAVIDVMMPGHNGLWLATELQREHPHTAVVLATAYTDLLQGDSNERPIADLLIKPFRRERFALAVDRGRQWRKRAVEELRWHAVLTMELRDRVDDITEGVREHTADGATEADALAAIASERASEMMTHAERVRRFAQSVGHAMGVDAVDLAVIDAGARFHDVGKAAMPEALLTKPSPLTPGESAIMRRHVDAGADILTATRTLREAALLVLSSHEWFNGGGYPRKLAKGDIPLGSRIIAVADAYDAMTQDRSYRPRIDSKDAVAELLRCAGAQFDPAVVDAFLEVLSRH